MRAASARNYFPLRHPDSENFERENVARWLKDLIAAGVRFVTQNGLYDWGWLRTDLGITMPPSEQLEEIGALATLIDENRFTYSLDASVRVARTARQGHDACWRRQSRLPASRSTRRTRCNPTFGNCRRISSAPTPRPTRSPPWRCSRDLNPILDQEGTRDAYRLDVDLLPMVHEMRRRGIRVDQSAAEQARDYCLQKRDQALAELSEQLGTPVSMDEIASPKWKARTFDAHHDRLSAHGERQPVVQGRQTRAGWPHIRIGCRS